MVLWTAWNLKILSNAHIKQKLHEQKRHFVNMAYISKFLCFMQNDWPFKGNGKAVWTAIFFIAWFSNQLLINMLSEKWPVDSLTVKDTQKFSDFRSSYFVLYLLWLIVCIYMLHYVIRKKMKKNAWSEIHLQNLGKRKACIYTW